MENVWEKTSSLDFFRALIENVCFSKVTPVAQYTTHKHGVNCVGWHKIFDNSFKIIINTVYFIF